VARAPKEKSGDSVFDFLYVDHRRIGLYLAQFSDFGNLTRLVQSRRVTDDAGLSAGVPGVAKGQTTHGQQEGVERHYDTQWSEVLTFLDEIQSRNMLEAGVKEATVGGLLLESGKLNILSVRPFERAFGALSEQPVQSTPTSGNRSQRRAAGRQVPQTNREHANGLRIMSALDHPIFMVLQSGFDRLWSTLSPDFMVGGSVDINLKYGVALDGTWHVVGILDCRRTYSSFGTETATGRLCGQQDNTFSDAAVSLWDEYRQVLGRPTDCHGITPLVIMREIS